MTAPKPTPPSTCRRCDQPISWWVNANRKGMIPVDPSSDDEKGTIRKIVTRVRDGRGGLRDQLVGQKLSKDEVVRAMANGEMLFTHHSDTCIALRPVNPKPAHVQLNLPPRRHGPQPGSARHRVRGRR